MKNIEGRYDALIAGTGAAGLCCALNLPRTARVLLITKDAADRSDSFLAQGGICMLRGEGDFAGYFEDTMRAGHYENDEAAVRQMIERSPAMIEELVGCGVRFARDEAGNFRFTREGGHSRPRILFHGDETGKEITSHLLAEARARDNLTILEYTEILDVIVGPEGCCGGVLRDIPSGEVFPVYADATLLATGGGGRTVPPFHQLPPPDGDALGIALRRGIAVEHLDYVQIHPTHPLFGKAGAALPHLRIGARRGRGASGQGGARASATS